MTAPAPRKDRLVAFISAVWNRGDVGTLGDYVADAYTIHHDPGDPWDGMTLDLAGFADRVVRSRAAFPDQRFAIRHLLAEEDGVAMFWDWSATHQGGLPSFPATGAPVRLSGATLYFFDEADRLTGHWQITDRLGVFQQLSRQRAGAVAGASSA